VIAEDGDGVAMVRRIGETLPSTLGLHHAPVLGRWKILPPRDPCSGHRAGPADNLTADRHASLVASGVAKRRRQRI